MLTIGEFSRICRVSTKTLRYYDQIGLLKPEHVSKESGYRYYEMIQMERLLFIMKLKQYQFSLPEIASALAKNDAKDLAERIREKKQEILRRIEDQEELLARMQRDIEKMERCENIMDTNYVIKTIEMQPKTIYSLRKKMGLKDFGSTMGELCGGMEKQGIKPAGPFLAIYHDEEFDPESSDIEVGVQVAATSGDHIRTLAGGLACFATHIGPYDDFSQCYAALAEWIEKEGYQIAGPPFELYIKGCEGNTDPSQYVTEIYFPIKK